LANARGGIISLQHVNAEWLVLLFWVAGHRKNQTHFKGRASRQIWFDIPSLRGENIAIL
jgi:hypothetical protein